MTPEELLAEFPEFASLGDARLSPWDGFGIECGDGWLPLVRDCFIAMRAFGFRPGQVKEKFGYLRVYPDPVGEQATPDAWASVRAAVDAAERASANVCEECGAPGFRRDTGWIRTLCDAHGNGAGPFVMPDRGP